MKSEKDNIKVAGMTRSEVNQTCSASYSSLFTILSVPMQPVLE